MPVALSPLALGTVIDRTVGVEQFQIAQTAPTTLRLRLRLRLAYGTDPEPVWQTVQGEIRHLLTEHGLDHVAIERADEPPQQSPAANTRRWSH